MYTLKSLPRDIFSIGNVSRNGDERSMLSFKSLLVG